MQIEIISSEGTWEGTVEDFGVVIEVSGPWAGGIGDWRPAVTGTLNQSAASDEDASTFDSRDAAMGFFESCIQPDLDDEPRCAETPRFRLRSGDVCETIG